MKRKLWFLATILAAAAVVAPSAFGESNDLDARIVAPGSKISGKFIGEWTESWWVWLLASPHNRNPAMDESGADCGVGQGGPVWFLAGSYSPNPMMRRCRVPTGKYILFPMQTGIVKPLPENVRATCDYSRDKAARGAELVLGIYMSVDGAPLTAPQRFRESSTACFDPSGTGRAISAQDGYWIMLRPLPPGKHILRYGRDEKGGKENTNVSYILEVGTDTRAPESDRKPDGPAPFPQLIPNERNLSFATDRPESTANSGEPTYSDFPRYTSAILIPRPGFSLRDFKERLVALILREGKYRVVSYNLRSLGAIEEIRFSWPDVKQRYAASDDLKTKMPHPMYISIREAKDGALEISVGSVNPNGGSSFALRAQIVSDAARMVAKALDRRAPVTDEERLRAIRYVPEDFVALAGGDPLAEILNRPAPANPGKGDKRISVTGGDAPRVFPRTPGDVVFEAPVWKASISPDGLTLTRCEPGLSTAITTNRSYIQGKLYFEMTLKVGADAAHPQTGVDVGLAPATVSDSIFDTPPVMSPESAFGVIPWAGAGAYRNGDVFGIAADLDHSRFYFHVNGDWKGKPPGSEGIPITPGRAYAAAASVSGSSAGTSAKCDGWTGNFGKAPFKYPLPQGYMSYDGRVSGVAEQARAPDTTVGKAAASVKSTIKVAETCGFEEIRKRWVLPQFPGLRIHEQDSEISNGAIYQPRGRDMLTSDRTVSVIASPKGAQGSTLTEFRGIAVRHYLSTAPGATMTSENSVPGGDGRLLPLYRFRPGPKSSPELSLYASSVFLEERDCFIEATLETRSQQVHDAYLSAFKDFVANLKRR